jgi:hypothetical protein
MRSRVIVVLASLLILGSAVPSTAQYFGRNKVQYERFDFKVLATEHSIARGAAGSGSAA